MAPRNGASQWCLAITPHNGASQSRLTMAPRNHELFSAAHKNVEISAFHIFPLWKQAYYCPIIDSFSAKWACFLAQTRLFSQTLFLPALKPLRHMASKSGLIFFVIIWWCGHVASSVNRHDVVKISAKAQMLQHAPLIRPIFHPYFTNFWSNLRI